MINDLTLNEILIKISELETEILGSKSCSRLQIMEMQILTEKFLKETKDLTLKKLKAKKIKSKLINKQK